MEKCQKNPAPSNFGKQNHFLIGSWINFDSMFIKPNAVLPVTQGHTKKPCLSAETIKIQKKQKNAFQRAPHVIWWHFFSSGFLEKSTEKNDHVNWCQWPVPPKKYSMTWEQHRPRAFLISGWKLAISQKCNGWKPCLNLPVWVAHGAYIKGVTLNHPLGFMEGTPWKVLVYILLLSVWYETMSPGDSPL